MKKKLKKKGISLIVLVITIVVIVILAVAVILSIANNNPIENANKAVFFNDMSALNDELALYLTNQIGNGSVKNISTSGEDLKEILPSIKDKYLDKLEIINGKLTYTSDEDIKELNWAKEYFEGVKANFEKVNVEGGSTIDIESAKETKVENIKIYGNSIQNGTPSPENPVEVESVGELVTDESDTNYGKYKIPITVSGKNMFDISSSNGFYSQYGELSNTIDKDKITIISSSENERGGILTLGTFEPGTYCITANIISGNKDYYLLTVDNKVLGGTNKLEKGKEAIITIDKKAEIRIV